MEGFTAPVDHSDHKTFDEARRREFKCQVYSISNLTELDTLSRQTLIGSAEFKYGDLIGEPSQMIKTKQNLMMTAKGQLIISMSPINIDQITDRSPTESEM